MSHPEKIPVRFDVSPQIYKGLSAMASREGRKAPDQARLMFEAAYTARLGISTGDSRLDTALRAPLKESAEQPAQTNDAALLEEVRRLGERLTSESAELTTANIKITQLEEKLSKANKTADDLIRSKQVTVDSSKVATLEAQVKDLQEKLDRAISDRNKANGALGGANKAKAAVETSYKRLSEDFDAVTDKLSDYETRWLAQTKAQTVIDPEQTNKLPSGKYTAIDCFVATPNLSGMIYLKLGPFHFDLTSKATDSLVQQVRTIFPEQKQLEGSATPPEALSMKNTIASLKTDIGALTKQLEDRAVKIQEMEGRMIRVTNPTVTPIDNTLILPLARVGLERVKYALSNTPTDFAPLIEYLEAAITEDEK